MHDITQYEKGSPFTEEEAKQFIDKIKSSLNFDLTEDVWLEVEDTELQVKSHSVCKLVLGESWMHDCDHERIDDFEQGGGEDDAEIISEINIDTKYLTFDTVDSDFCIDLTFPVHYDECITKIFHAIPKSEEELELRSDFDKWWDNTLSNNKEAMREYCNDIEFVKKIAQKAWSRE